MYLFGTLHRLVGVLLLNFSTDCYESHCGAYDEKIDEHPIKTLLFHCFINSFVFVFFFVTVAGVAPATACPLLHFYSVGNRVQLAC